MLTNHKTRPQPTPQFTPPQTPRGDARFTEAELEKAMGDKPLRPPVAR